MSYSRDFESVRVQEDGTTLRVNATSLDEHGKPGTKDPATSFVVALRRRRPAVPATSPTWSGRRRRRLDGLLPRCAPDYRDNPPSSSSGSPTSVRAVRRRCGWNRTRSRPAPARRSAPARACPYDAEVPPAHRRLRPAVCAARHGRPRRVAWTRSQRRGRGRFGRMFPGLPACEPADETIDALVAGLEGAREENPYIPAGYTYLAQFVDHDITFDPQSSLERANDPHAPRELPHARDSTSIRCTDRDRPTSRSSMTGTERRDPGVKLLVATQRRCRGGPRRPAAQPAGPGAAR